MKTSTRNIILILAILAIAIVPLVTLKNAAFGGTDDKGMQLIQTIDSSYKPWFQKIELFKSAEITSSLFALQAALGAGFLGYYIGFTRGKKKNSVVN
jgi:cobalt/nickel transport protein